MLTLNLKPIFKARGIERPYSYLVKSGFNSHTAHNLLNNKTISFQLRHIDKLCSLLICTPNDLLVWTPNRNEVMAGNHPLTSLKKRNIDLNWQDSIKTATLDDLELIVNAINKLKSEKKS